MPSPSPPLWKKLLGAAIGTAIALGFYQAYDLASPRLQALLFKPPSGHTAAPLTINRGEEARKGPMVSEGTDATDAIDAVLTSAPSATADTLGPLAIPSAPEAPAPHPAGAPDAPLPATGPGLLSLAGGALLLAGMSRARRLLYARAAL